MSRADWKQLRDKVAAEPAPPTQPEASTTEFAEIQAEIPMETPDTPTPPAVEVKAEISVSTPPRGRRKPATKKAKSKAKKKAKTPKRAKKNNKKRASTHSPTKELRVETEETETTSPDVPSTKINVENVEVRKPHEPSEEEKRRMERPFEELWKNDPDPAPSLMMVKEGCGGGDEGSSGSADLDGGGVNRHYQSSFPWLPAIIAVAAVLIVLIVVRGGGFSFIVHQPSLGSDDTETVQEVGSESPAPHMEQSVNVFCGQSQQPPQRTGVVHRPRPTTHVCERDTVYVPDGKDF